MKIGLLIIATNKYVQFVNDLIASADKNFCKNHEVNYYIFSDLKFSTQTTRNTRIIHTEHKKWPWMTLGRYDIFDKNQSVLSEMDYLYYCDADMLFVDKVGDEILSERVATHHPGFCGGRGTPECRPESLACVSSSERMEYFAGGFNGGTSKEYLRMCKVLSDNIKIDFKNNIIAIWHDESHMNRYFIDNPPTKILSPSYCFAEHLMYRIKPKIVSIYKDNKKLHV